MEPLKLPSTDFPLAVFLCARKFLGREKKNRRGAAGGVFRLSGENRILFFFFRGDAGRPEAFLWLVRGEPDFYFFFRENRKSRESLGLSLFWRDPP